MNLMIIILSGFILVNTVEILPDTQGLLPLNSAWKRAPSVSMVEEIKFNQGILDFLPNNHSTRSACFTKSHHGWCFRLRGVQIYVSPKHRVSDVVRPFQTYPNNNIKSNTKLVDQWSIDREVFSKTVLDWQPLVRRVLSPSTLLHPWQTVGFTPNIRMVVDQGYTQQSIWFKHIWLHLEGWAEERQGSFVLNSERIIFRIPLITRLGHLNGFYGLEGSDEQPRLARVACWKKHVKVEACKRAIC